MQECDGRTGCLLEVAWQQKMAAHSKELHVGTMKMCGSKNSCLLEVVWY
jgi:hypothetical protein